LIDDKDNSISTIQEAYDLICDSDVKNVNYNEDFAKIIVSNHVKLLMDDNEISDIEEAYDLICDPRSEYYNENFEKIIMSTRGKQPGSML